MAFDLERFRAAQFEPRTKSVDASDLAEVLGVDESERAGFTVTVRSITADELQKAQNRVKARDRTEAFIQALSDSGTSKQKAETMRELTGLSQPDPETETIIGQELIAMAAIEPQFDISDAVKLSEVSPVCFKRIVAAIYELLGAGMDLKKTLKSVTATAK